MFDAQNLGNFALTLAGVILQYGMLLWLLYFLVKLGAIMRADLVKLSASGGSYTEAADNEAILTCVAGDDKFLGRRFAFADKISLGRAGDNDIVLPENFVSHRHAVIRRKNNLYVIEDLGSANHTYLNDRELTGRAYLKVGDHIRIGTLLFEFAK